jgi:signal transduction histidine kinase
MGQDNIVVGFLGGGERSREILSGLLATAGVEVRYVAGRDPDAPAMTLARERGLRCVAGELPADADVDLVVDAGDDPAVSVALAAAGPARGRVIDGDAARLVAGLAAEVAAVEEGARAEKARYLRQASHQVKSPLSSIQTSVNVILAGYTGEIPEKTREVVQKIHGRCDAALAALAKRRLLADLRCVRPGALDANATADAGELAAEAVARHAERAAARGVELRLLPPAGPALVRGEPVHLAALASELVENAVVYSRDGGLVEVAVEPRPDGRVALVVRDRGIGIPERCLPRIFDEDYRADSAAGHHPDGAGLGLAIVREVAGLHDVELDVRSEEGRGTEVTASMTAAPGA